MLRKKGFLLIILAMIFNTGVLAGAEISKLSGLHAKKALSLNLTQEGLDFISHVALEKLSKDLQEKKIDDIDLKIPFTANIKVEQIKFGLKLDYLKIVPHESGLKLSLGLKNLHLSIGHFRASNPLLPTVGMSCFNTSVEMASGSLSPIEIDVDAKVKDQNVHLDLNDFYFHLNRNQFTSFGPRDCQGLFGVRDYVTQFVIKEVLSSARPFINMGTKLAVKGLFKFLDKKLNSMIKEKSFPLSLPKSNEGTSPKMHAFMIPEKFVFNHGTMGLLVSVRLAEVNEKGLELEEEDDLEFLKYFSIGIKPELVNVLIKGLFPGKKLPKIELKEEMHEVIGALLDKSELANFLPDLEKVDLDQDKLRLFVSLKKYPSVGLDSSGQLNLSIPHVGLNFMAKRNGEWSDYFTFNIDLKVGLDIAINGPQLGLSLDMKKLSLEGEWPDSYSPMDKTFFREDAEESFKSLIYMVSSELEDSPLLALPSFEFGDREITFKNFKIENGFIFIDIVPLN
ncbi:MAG: hypothetical protein VYD54_04650 [Bdellovibrionota bacterium]|nr:hypothetical protein [Bdellovibrionota bacterium]